MEVTECQIHSQSPQTSKQKWIYFSLYSASKLCENSDYCRWDFYFPLQLAEFCGSKFFHILIDTKNRCCNYQCLVYWKLCVSRRDKISVFVWILALNLKWSESGCYHLLPFLLGWFDISPWVPSFPLVIQNFHSLGWGITRFHNIPHKIYAFVPLCYFIFFILGFKACPSIQVGSVTTVR